VKPGLIISLFILFSVYSCHSGPKKSPVLKVTGHNPKSKNAEPLKLVYGYRFIIKGNFDGKSENEILTEHYFSGIDHKETNKFYESTSDTGSLEDNDTLFALTIKRKTYSFITSDIKGIDTLKIAAGGTSFGLAYLKNEGDLDGDGRDEVSYVIDYLQMSSLNECFIMTFKNGRWRKFYSFPIWQWQLPDLPQTYNNYGGFGRQNKVVDTENVAANKVINKKLNDFPGLVKKVANNKIQIIYRHETADDIFLDSAIVNLRTGRKRSLRH
jgi:hypothetical protein